MPVLTHIISFDSGGHRSVAIKCAVEEVPYFNPVVHVELSQQVLHIGGMDGSVACAGPVGCCVATDNHSWTPFEGVQDPS